MREGGGEGDPPSRRSRREEGRSAGEVVPSVTAVARRSRSPFKVLVSTVISARTKDEVTGQAARRLFAVAATPRALSALPETRIAAAHIPSRLLSHERENDPRPLKEDRAIARKPCPRYDGGASFTPGGREKDGESRSHARFRPAGDLRRHARASRRKPARHHTNRNALSKRKRVFARRFRRGTGSRSTICS